MRSNELDCSKYIPIMESYTPSGLKCISLFSDLITTKYKYKYFLNEFINFAIYYDTIIDSAFIHHNITPPHLYTHMIEVGNYNLVKGFYLSRREHLLPYPYKTNCFDYRKNSNDYRSREDCIVKYFQRKEFHKCGCNTKWLYYDYRNITDVKICTNSNKCEFKFKYNNLLMDKICGKNCYNIHFDYRFDRTNITKIKVFSVGKAPGNEILLTHLPKMNLVDYFCSIGGLFSMWFGISLFHLLLFIEEKLNHCVEKYFRFNQSIIDLRIRLVQYIERLKLKKLLKLLIIILYSTAMLYQITDVIQTYLKYDKVTRFEISQKQLSPSISLMFMPEFNKFSKLKIIYPEIIRDKDYIKVMKIHNIDVRNYQMVGIFYKYLDKLINELRFEQFLEITDGKNIIKSCKVFKNKQVLNCFGYKYAYLKVDGPIYLLFTIIFENKTSGLYENNVRFAHSLEKIELELKEKKFMNLFFGRSSLHDKDLIGLEKNTKTEIGFISYTNKKLSTHTDKCSEGNRQNHENYSQRDCFSDCLYRNLNQTYGCLAAVSLLHLDFESDLIFRRYRLCDYKRNSTIDFSIKRKCEDLCLPECQSVNHNTMVLVKRFQKRKFRTFVEIFPLKFPHFIYTETLSMDFNQLIYNWTVQSKRGP
jgi:hypothetical protein